MKPKAPTRRRIITGTSLRVYCVASLLFTALACFAFARASAAQGTAMRVEMFTFNPGGQVRIENARGATRIESWESQNVRVIAEKVSPAGSALDPSELMLMGAQNTLTIGCRQGARPGRVDLTIFAPPNARLEIVGSAFPVEVSGQFAGAIVETTSGSISYRIPTNADARVVMRSARGVVRSTAPLTISDRAGTQSIQGSIGSGAALVMLNSLSGNVTLTPGPPAVGMLARTAVDSSIQNAPANNSTYQAAETRPQDQVSQPRSSGPIYRPSSLPPADQPDQDGTQPGAPPARSPQRAPNSTAQTTGGGSVVFAGGDRSDDSDVEIRSGPLARPRQEKRTESGNSGLRVRIIPSNVPLGSSRDTGSIYQDTDAQSSTQQSSGGYPSSTRSSSQSQRPSYDTQRDPYNPRASAPADVPFDREPVASSKTRPASPPALHRSDEPDDPPTAATSPSPERASEASDVDNDSIVLKSALVNLNVVVTNRSGVALPNLKKEDFEIYENGQPQSIGFFQPTNAPFNLVLLLDLSGSIKDKLDVVKSAALKFVDVVGPQDRIAIVAFTQDVMVVSQLTSNREELKRRIKTIERPEGGTAFYEAMWFALADTLRGTEGQRNAIVVMTDGVDSSLDRYNPAPTRVSFGRLAQRLEESDVIVFPVYLDTEYEEVFERGNSTSEAYAIARDQLARVAELTGGQMFKAEKASDLAGVYKQVATALRTVYSVGYYPTNTERDGTYRRVRVTVNRPDAAVRTRKGYYAK